MISKYVHVSSATLRSFSDLAVIYQKALDIGTGTGKCRHLMACHVAMILTTLQVYGLCEFGCCSTTDFVLTTCELATSPTSTPSAKSSAPTSPLSSQAGSRPTANCEIPYPPLKCFISHLVISEIEDCNQEWTFDSDSFDYVHFRYLIGCIPDWPALFKQAYRVLKPGGWIESFEVSPTVTSDDNTVAPDSALAQWDKMFIEASKKIGNSFTVVADQIQKPAMEEAGFVNIKEWNGKVSQPSYDPAVFS